jgi:hypothetical protein
VPISLNILTVHFENFINLFLWLDQAYYRHVGMEFLGIPAYDTITFNLSRYFYESACFIDEALRSGGITKFSFFCFVEV